MFAEHLTNIPIFGEDACEKFFPHVRTMATGGAPENDRTIDAVAKAILEPRLAALDKKITISYDPDVLHLKECHNTLMLFTCRESTMEENIRYIDNNSEYVDWHHMTDLERFIDQQLSTNIAVYQNSELNSTMITGPVDAKVAHAIAFFIPRFFKFAVENNPLTDEEMELLKSLLRYNSSDFKERMEKVSDALGLASKVNGVKIASAMKTFWKSMYDKAQNEMLEARAMVENQWASYVTALERKNESFIKLEGAKSLYENEQDNTELIEFMESNPNIKLINITPRVIEMVIESYLDIYDADAFETYRNGFFDSLSTRWADEDNKLLLRDIFSADPTFHIRTCGYYCLDMMGYVHTQSCYAYNRPDRLPNPHLQYHGCLGQNTESIQAFMQKGNIVGAIMQCYSSSMSVNVSEVGPTFRPFCEEIMNSRQPILEKIETGEQYTVDAAIMELRALNATVEEEAGPEKIPVVAEEEPASEAAPEEERIVW